MASGRLYFNYGKKETDYLKRQDSRLATVIGRVGHIYREVDDNLFSAVVHHIIGQQISTKAQTTIWNRMRNALEVVNANTVNNAKVELLQSFGMSFRKADYIKEFAQKVSEGSFDIDGIWGKSDEEAISELTSLRGIGVWTAEMILLFCMERPDILSYDDLALRRGLCIVHNRRSISKELFKKYRARYSPYGSTASLYLWKVAGGALDDTKRSAKLKR